MRIEIKSRWSDKVKFTTNINGNKFRTISNRLGAAILAAIKEGANLEGAYLAGANLKGANLAGANLKGANLEGANLKGANLAGANLEGANLEGAYLAGAYLAGANLEGANLKGANLKGANLAGANLKGANLEGANLKGTYLAGANLKGTYLAGANLKGANLEGANLEGANLKGANLAGVPRIENIHQTVYNAAKNNGDLEMNSWHSNCGTTHCRAGWVVTLAGEDGKKLEDKIGTACAAYAIIYKSDPDIDSPINFYDTNERALAELKRLAKKEATKD